MRNLVRNLLILAVVVAVIIGVRNECHRVYAERLAQQTACDAVVSNAYHSISGGRDVIDDVDKVNFLRYLGVKDVIESGIPLQIVYNSKGEFFVLYGVKFVIGDSINSEVNYEAKPNVLGPFSRAKIEEYSNANIKWIE